MSITTRDNLLDIRRIYLEPAAAELPRGREILARYPDAELVGIAGHHRIPELGSAPPLCRDRTGCWSAARRLTWG
ncbi:hypothetical protein [Nonomuraea longispora]|uniref:hypothetical protein n=1 Tax=Nonomuraea longispora TaxID=1848320 RepID=UPI001C70312E|nr:hypothetical protein [Nonomuraea longispora]